MTSTLKLAHKRHILRALIGFTLIEGMLMFTALGIAASLTFTRYMSFGSSAMVSARATQVNNINSLLEGFVQNGGTLNATATAAPGNSTTNGAIKDDNLTDVLTSLATGVYAGGIQYQIPSATINWNGATPTIVGDRLN